MCGGDLVGDPSLQIIGAASLGEAVPGEISFYSDPRYGTPLRKTRASAVFVPPDFAESIATAQVRVANPIKVFEQVVLKFAPKPITFGPGIHSSAIVDPSAHLGGRVSIQPYAVIEAGARIGDDTIIGAGSYVGHETVIGSACLIYPRVTIRERSRVGERVTMAGQVGIVGHVEIADGSVIAAQSGVSKSVPGGVWFGYPARPIEETKQQIAWIRRLRKLFERVKDIEKKLGL